MGRSRIKTGILTSSRADYGIYLPLLRRLDSDPAFDMQLLVFGTHLAKRFGYTAELIESDGFKIEYRLETCPESDSPADISKSMAETIRLFSGIWEKGCFDLIFALGDRYEMFSAAASSIPFNIKIAHIHGGEETLGAIDNSFRHSLTSMADLHFTACDEYRKRVIAIKGREDGVYNTGALSIDLLNNMQFLTVGEFYRKYNIDLSKPSILFTFHPETLSYQKTREHIGILMACLERLTRYQVVITMPNADTYGNIIREYIRKYLMNNANAMSVESFGSQDYLTCMKYCSFMLGNSSSGFIEASWFPRPVINVGERQKGRIVTTNIFQAGFNEAEILSHVSEIENRRKLDKSMIYGDGTAAVKIIEILKKKI